MPKKKKTVRYRLATGTYTRKGQSPFVVHVGPVDVEAPSGTFTGPGVEVLPEEEIVDPPTEASTR